MFTFHKKKISESVVTMILILGFWIIITLPSDLFSLLGLKNILQHLILGLFFALLVNMVIPHPILTREEIEAYLNPVVMFRFFIYIIRLSIDLVKAGIDVSERVLRRNILISPGIVEVETPLSKDIEIALNANSITITPGTITIDVQKTAKGSRFIVHCISQKAVHDILENGGFVKRIQDCFGSSKKQ